MENYKIFCFGGSGGNICTALLSIKAQTSRIFYFNTDKLQVESTPIVNKYVIGLNITKGNSCFNDIDLAKQAFDDDIEIFDNLTNESCLYIIVSGFGGGTGTGMSTKIANLLTKKQKDFIVIGTLPFHFEGMAKRKQALFGSSEIKKHTDKIIILESEDLNYLFTNLTLSEAFLRLDFYIIEVIKEILFEYKVNHITNKDLLSHNIELKKVLLKIKNFINSKNTFVATTSSKIILPDTNKKLLKALSIDSKLIYAISPRKFEEVIEYIYRLSGYETQLTSSTRDDGVDILVWTPPPVLGNRFLTIVQAKRYNQAKKVGSEEIRELIGSKIIFNADKAQIITTSDFSVPAKKTAISSNIDLIKFYELNNRINELIK